MKVTSVIVLTAHCTEDSRPQLAARFERLLGMGLSPVLVLGANGDMVLRSLPRIDECEFAYNPNGNDDYFSNLKAGLLAVQGPSFVYALHEEMPAREAWTMLGERLGRIPGELPVDVLRFDANTQPQLVTLHGLKNLRRFKSIPDWAMSKDILFMDVER